MLWSFIAVFFSGWLYVDASYRGPAWQRWIFKPITLLLLLMLAWQAPVFTPLYYLVLAGLVASLAGDTLSQMSGSTPRYAFMAFFVSHLLYAVWFASQLSFSFFWPAPLALLIIGALLLATIWSRLDTLRLPVTLFIAATLAMVWMAAEQWFSRPVDTSFSGFVGAALLLLSNIVWLVSRYRYRFKGDTALAAACYFAGHFMIVRALYL
ncbi:lysoplasmalogenase [Shimwellia blattae]|uniref:Putative membrane protein n=1 Tax=Shimwellia blattae (strain ATCC 29907 / DSM 4481 / JCM 1650 / NBRC 105725 / CDC 9005-74) TaxID=630626 RepID=I2B460_SHIBC|nr:lysoplasmalogenase [Shimwellia blattae]AFJ45314.1 putative membrane protein [Shimwellia blattae DSM 4481 = NBRC 105725]GAB80573.1 hypothetical protein YhhN [Shimwellia blattae DSM 4481 = NBRC 105725]VDY62795.1 YhhN-like protein [Shimwellia blattae]VEC19647.1 YhhN-like protein [Shimwellia blattae]